MVSSEQTTALDAALAGLHTKLRALEPDKQGQVGSQKTRYCPLDSVWEYLRPILPEFGLDVLQVPDIHPEAGPFLRTRIIHVASGEYIEGTIPIRVGDGPGSDSQRYGSALTYARRYALVCMTGMTIGEEDNDGMTAGTVNRGTARTASDNSQWVKTQQDSARFKDEIGKQATPEKLHAWWVENLPAISELTPDLVAEIKALVAARHRELGGETKPKQEPKTEAKAQAKEAPKPKAETKATPAKKPADDPILNEFD